jgi:hypothetical protein
MKRTLTLKKDTLTELSPDDLGHVVGGTTGPVSRTCALWSFAPCYLIGYVVQTVVEGCLP